MNTSKLILTIIFCLVIMVPIILWNNITNPELKFTMGLFLAVFSGYFLFRNMELFFKSNSGPGNTTNSVMIIILTIYLLVTFYVYSIRIFNVVGSIG